VEAATAGGSGAPPSVAALGLARRLLGWPGAALFPCLDVARCLVLQPEAAAALAEHAGSLEGSNGGSGLGAALAAAAAVGAPPGLQTGLRSAANCFRAPPLRVWLLSQLGPLLDAYTGMAASPGGTKAVRLAMATLLLNGAIAGGGGDGDVRLQLLSAVVTLLDATPEGEADAAARTAAALSTLLGAPDGGELAAVARDLGAGAALQRLRGALAPGSAAASALDAASAALK
jgi:PUL domain